MVFIKGHLHNVSDKAMYKAYKKFRNIILIEMRQDNI